MTTHIEGGVCAPQGFTANAVMAEVKPGRKRNDVALVYAEKPCNAAAVFTTNLVKAEPVKLSRKHIADGKAQAIILNSGNANACTGETGAQNALRMAKAVSANLPVKTEDVIVCSTGVIGQQLLVERIEAKAAELVKGLSKSGNELARQAIMTTDTVYKEVAVETQIGGKKVRIGTMAKGSGMIHINMGTMLGVITTDCAISSAMLKAALEESIKGSYNCVTVDGDTSTNDTLCILASGMAGNAEITTQNEDYTAFLSALNEVNVEMAKKIAGDGEGAERLIECVVTGAASVESARKLARSVISSNLVKAAFFGKDANWGRILCAMGYSGEKFDTGKVCVSFVSKAGKVDVCKNGMDVDFDEDFATKVLSEDAVTIAIQCTDGSCTGTAWGCDLTYEYVKINGDYRT
ncbi:MAG: bifunctional glutamate N-acetyltransferase/amino-acid acetyltransferase ArgJ [Spirochaetaceae bacterium]|nr:bifunctional glutamate N-acetyltransferase/amino-acid acetyltransferase ArgJ [Spirochaetaceae bacterium]